MIRSKYLTLHKCFHLEYLYFNPFTPLNISHVRNGTTFGCSIRDSMATATDFAHIPSKGLNIQGYK
jgi:hypothetical protein